MKSILSKFVSVPSLIAMVIIYALLLTGCPKQSIDNAKKYSKKFATATNTGVDITRELYRSKLLTLEQKDAIADGWIALAQAGQIVDQAIANAERVYGPESVPKAEVEKIFEVIDKEVVDKLLALIEQLKLAKITEEMKVAIEGVKTAIILFAKLVGRKTEMEARLAAV